MCLRILSVYFILIFFPFQSFHLICILFQVSYCSQACKKLDALGHSSECQYLDQVLFCQLWLQCTVPWLGTVLSTMAAVYSTLIRYCIVNYCFSVQYLDQALYYELLLPCTVPWSVTLMWTMAAVHSSLISHNIVHWSGTALRLILYVTKFLVQTIPADLL